MTNPDQGERERFEKYLKSRPSNAQPAGYASLGFSKNTDGSYCIWQFEYDWQTWQAALSQAQPDGEWPTEAMVTVAAKVLCESPTVGKWAGYTYLAWMGTARQVLKSVASPPARSPSASAEALRETLERLVRECPFDNMRVENELLLDLDELQHRREWLYAFLAGVELHLRGDGNGRKS